MLWDVSPRVVPFWKARESSTHQWTFGDRAQYELLEPWRFYVDGKSLDAPVGFRFEASIPALAWLLASTPFDPRVIAGACGHDALYRNAIPRQGITQAQADQFLRAACLYCGLPSRKARRIYWGVYVFGRFSWQDEKKPSQLG